MKEAHAGQCWRYLPLVVSPLMTASSPVAHSSNGVFAVVSSMGAFAGGVIVDVFAVDNLTAGGIVVGSVVARGISFVGNFAVVDVFAVDNLIANGAVVGGVIARGISSVGVFAAKQLCSCRHQNLYN